MNNGLDRNSSIITTRKVYDIRLNTTLKMIIAVLLLQLSMICIKKIAFVFLENNKNNDMMISTLILSLAVAFILYKSKSKKMLLDIFDYIKEKESKNYYIIVSFSISILILIQCITKPLDELIPILYITIFIPIAEEIIFRFYIWNELQSKNCNEVKTYILTSVLFCAYNIGTQSIMISNNITILAVFIKLITIIGMSLIIGIFKYQIKNTYSCIIVHSFFNIFML